MCDDRSAPFDCMAETTRPFRSGCSATFSSPMASRPAWAAVLKMGNESGKKRTFPALGGFVTRRRFTEPARAAVVFMRRGAAGRHGRLP